MGLFIVYDHYFLRLRHVTAVSATQSATVEIHSRGEGSAAAAHQIPRYGVEASGAAAHLGGAPQAVAGILLVQTPL